VMPQAGWKAYSYKYNAVCTKPVFDFEDAEHVQIFQGRNLCGM
jgi:hypothetical protein